MHVVVDAIGNHVGGGWSVLSRTVAAIVGDRRISQLTVFCSPLCEVAGEVPVAARLTWVERPREHSSLRARLAWYTVGLAMEARRIDADVVLCMNGMGWLPIPHVNVIQQAFAVWGGVLDLRPLKFAIKQAGVRRQTGRSCREAASVIVQTDWMRTQAMASLGRGDIRVLPLGLPRVAHGERTDSSALLCVTNELPYKRNEVMLGAFQRLREEFPQLTLTVTPETATSRGTATRSMASEDVLQLMRSSMALVAPSDVESFGLPVVEAFAAGCPVVAADRPWARAVADNAALYFRPGAADDAAVRIAELLRDDRLASDLARRGAARLRQLWDLQPYRSLVDLLQEAA